MVNRSANATIKGYFYQFDFAIRTILQLYDDTYEITVEGVEDVDINNASDESYVQCKYYAATEYNHSIIKPAIQAMLTHFKTTGQFIVPLPKYNLYGYYSSGQQKLPEQPLTTNFIKEHFLTSRPKDKPIEELHKTLDISDTEIENFIKNLHIDIYAQSYEAQYETICGLIQHNIRQSTREDIDHLYYPAAINVIRELAIQQSVLDRKISRRAFMARIDRKLDLFNSWIMQYNGITAYNKYIKKTFFNFSQATSIYNKNRFFLFPANSSDIKTVVRLLNLIAKKFSHVERTRTPDDDRFCPYAHVTGINENDYLEIKKSMKFSGLKFIDGYDFKGADFCTDSIHSLPTKTRLTQLKIIDTVDCLNRSLETVRGRQLEIFEFYKNAPVIELREPTIANHVKIKIDSLDQLIEILQ